MQRHIDHSRIHVQAFPGDGGGDIHHLRQVVGIQKDLLKCVSVLKYGVSKSTSNEYVVEFEEAIKEISGRMRERIIRDCHLALQIGFTHLIQLLK